MLYRATPTTAYNTLATPLYISFYLSTPEIVIQNQVELFHGPCLCLKLWQQGHWVNLLLVLGPWTADSLWAAMHENLILSYGDDQVNSFIHFGF